MKNILIVSPYSIENENSNGISKILYNFLRINASDYKFYMFSQGPTDCFGHSVKERFIFSSNTSKLYKILNLLRGKIFCYPNEKSRGELKAFIQKNHVKFDIVHLFGYQFIDIIDLLPQNILPKIRISLVDCNSLYFHRRSKVESNLIKKLLFFLESKKYSKIEHHIRQRKIPTHFVSQVDTDAFSTCFFSATTIENGVDTKKFYPSLSVNDNNCIKLLFFGNLLYGPNKMAVEFLIKKLMPYLQLSVKDKKTSLTIVGNNPNLSTKMENIVFTGYIEDLNTEINSSDIVLFPIFYGAGIKNKFLEAYAAGSKIISTSIAVDGINFIGENSKTLIIIDSNKPEAWSAAIENIFLAPKTLPESIPFTWERFTKLMLAFYEQKSLASS